MLSTNFYLAHIHYYEPTESYYLHSYIALLTTPWKRDKRTKVSQVGPELYEQNKQACRTALFVVFFSFTEFQLDRPSRSLCFAISAGKQDSFSFNHWQIKELLKHPQNSVLLATISTHNSLIKSNQMLSNHVKSYSLNGKI